MYKVERYIVMKEGRIVRDYHTAQGIDGVYKSLANEGISDYDEITSVAPSNSDIRVQTHKDEYDTGWKMKPLSTRVAAGHVKVPENHVLDGEAFRPMTLEEKVREGKEQIPVDMKAVGNEVVRKTDEELIAEGIKTRKQIDEEKLVREEEALIQAEMRKLAIERLGSKLKKVTA